ncbi:unnamed protein product [Peronospora belbahrii]|uniref:Uncharacterized protein n=1 Tax=Peronospora belbahrii TaxID=622444 RepID=A0AAU9KWQ0_9STRA|nr:unnamed protein product [Peronospora belbahrii]CAH0516055.1 unnamed protein product [Peronospora belbahrii]
MTAADEDAWDEWEDDASTSLLPSPCDTDLHDQKETTQTYPMVPNLPPCDIRKWHFDLDELEHEMSTLSPIADVMPLFSDSDVVERNEVAILSLIDGLPQALRAGRERIQTLEALALVTRLHVVAARGSFTELSNNIEQTQKQVAIITEELYQCAGEWGDRRLLETTLRLSERQQVEEMTELLHHSLSMDNDELTLFKDVLEQIVDGLPGQKLILSTNWLRSAEMEEKEVKQESIMSYLKQILAISSDDPGNRSRMPKLLEAEILQDAKDISRDELLINGKRVGGARGYDAVVDALQNELELVLARQAGKTPEQTPMAVSNALQSVAMTIVHASNRTESGGSSYELLSKFLSKHEMDRVLLRPASARAAPLEISLDLGPYLETIPGSNEPTWAFGLRVKLIAVTWYLVCDAKDPTTELYEIETTFCNRLAFPVGLTPFHPLDSMRKDHGNVTIRLVLEQETTSA